MLAFPGLLYRRRTSKALHLGHDRSLAKTIKLRFAPAFAAVKLTARQIADRLQPVIDQPERPATDRGPNAPATVVAAHDDVLHAQLMHRIFDHGEHVQIGRVNEIGDVAMNEHLARLQTRNHIGRHTAVGTAYPKILRLLQGCQAFKIVCFLGLSLTGPSLVPGEELFDHGYLRFLGFCRPLDQ